MTSKLCPTTALCLVMLGSALAQKPADTMTFDVVVTDKADRPVAGLKPENFTVLDNNAKQAITSVREVRDGNESSDPPVTAYLVVDEVNAVAEGVSSSSMLQQFLSQAGPRFAVPTSLIFFTDTAVKFQREPTRDPNVLRANLAGMQGTTRSVLAIGGMAELAQEREKSLQALSHIAVKLNDVKGRKLVIWVSPGWRAFSYSTHEKSKAELNQLFSFIVGISTALRQGGVTLFDVDTYGVSPYEWQESKYYLQYVKGVESLKQVDNGDLLLQVIALQTGGQVLFSTNNLGGMVEQCLADAQTFYEVTYSAPHARQANEYHAVEVAVDKPELKTRTRYGYYAQP